MQGSSAAWRTQVRELRYDCDGQGGASDSKLWWRNRPHARCHGPEAKGEGPFPRLAGQLHDYIFNKLVNWSKERGQDPANPDTSAIMAPIAHGLTQSQIKAVAAYLSYLD
jgi:Cytochrome c